ncbi:DUF221-domain-containing protein [Pholiota conissans]|uniref:DUF221-domain-containing protein n=1 Tax=Pholiota conissans TaxID=109636 RepID=A0A9P5ZEJ2_9AGAR|nr:DUF221-domain-containing protein [Pholiota conissans]
MAIHLKSRIDASGVQALLNSTQSLEPKAVGIQVLVMIVLSVLTVFTFNTLRPNNETVYEPKTKYHANGKHPPRISDHCCGWVAPLVYSDEIELVDKIGLDAVTFLRFMRLMRWLLTLTAIITCGVLIPLDFTYNISVKPIGYNILTAMTIQDVHGVRLWAHIGVVYVVTAILASFVLHHWRVIYRLRNEWFRSPEYQRLFYARTLCITDIPERRRSNAGLYGIFDGMQLPYPVTSVHIGKHVGHLPELIDRHNQLVEEFEKVLQNHLQGKNPTGRPVITVEGWCGIGTRRVDAIAYYTAKLQHSEAVVQQYRAQVELREPENYGFATIASIPLAHAAARELKGKHPKGLTIKLAPNPHDIFWNNMGLSKGERQFRKISGFLLLYTFCFLSLIPLFPVASLANLDAIATSGYIPFLKSWIQASPATYTLISGLIPPIIANIFASFIPILMRWLSKYMGATTHTALDRIFIARYFGFLFISQLVFFSVIGVLFNSILEIIIAIENQNGKSSLNTVFDNLNKLPARLTRTYVQQSSFWLKWYPLRGFLIIFDLSQLSELIYLSLKNRISGRTPRDIRESSKPPAFSYGIHYSNLLFMGLIGLLFAPVAPLISLAAAIIFWLCTWVYKYQLMYKFITRVESGGRAWNVVINRLLFSAMFMQVVIFITIALQVQFKSLQFLATIPPLLFMLIFKYYIKKRFSNDFEYYVPLHTELSRSIVYSEDVDVGENKLEQRYEHPVLHANLFSPMVHANMMPLLRRIYKGKQSFSDHLLTRGISQRSKKEISDHQVEEVMEGVGITPVNESELEYDPLLYKDDRNKVDCDFDSVNETSSTASSQAEAPQIPRHFSHQQQPKAHLNPGHEAQRAQPAGRSVSKNAEGVPKITDRALQHDRRHSLSPAPPHRTPYDNALGHDLYSSQRSHGAAHDQPVTRSEHTHDNYRNGRHNGAHSTQNGAHNSIFVASREEHTISIHNPRRLSEDYLHRVQDTGQHLLRTHQSRWDESSSPNVFRR